MHTVFALLCFVVVIHWLIFPNPSGLLHWHCGNLTIAPVPAKQPWWIWINTSCEFIMNDCITTPNQSTTKPCAYFLGYTVHAVIDNILMGNRWYDSRYISIELWNHNPLSYNGKKAIWMLCQTAPKPSTSDRLHNTRGLLPRGYCTRFAYIYVVVPFLPCAHGTLRAAILTDTSQPSCTVNHKLWYCPRGCRCSQWLWISGIILYIIISK